MQGPIPWIRNEVTPAVNRMEKDQIKAQSKAKGVLIFATTERAKKVMKIAAQPLQKRRFEIFTRSGISAKDTTRTRDRSELKMLSPLSFIIQWGATPS
jgi:hypothetical protein